MIDLETTVEISRPVTEVFAFVADQTNAPRWQGGLHEVRRLTEGPLGVGTEHEFIRRFAGRTRRHGTGSSRSRRDAPSGSRSQRDGSRARLHT
ncbi:MAG: SRPBCC family protein [Solirubrobacterales bacterium]|nr:SRPBCC family protein [Solirubrobacterales bacterium]